MSNKYQTFYYHIGEQNVDKFTVKVTLRKVLSMPTKETETSFQKQSFQDIKTYVGWQEKILGPNDRISRGRNRNGHELEYPASRIGEIRDRSCSDGAVDNCNIAEFQDEAFVYTYTDKDFYCPVTSRNDTDTDTNTNSVVSSTNTHLADAVSLLPVHNLLSSQSSSRDSAVVHDRLSREDPFQMMYIFAAVDCNTGEMSSILRSEQQVGATSNSDDVGVNLCHEELLCTLKLYKSGLLEATPGFSKIENEDSDDDEIFVSSEGLEKRATKGAKLTTFTFVTSIGSVYQYTLEWMDFLIDQTKLESLALREMDEHYRLLSQHRNTALSHLSERIRLADWLAQTGDEQMLQIEFMSAHGFYPQWNNSYLSIDYDINLPKSWQLSVAKFTCESENHSIVGSTMLSKAAHPSRFGNRRLSLPAFLLFLALFELAHIFGANLVLVITFIIVISIALKLTIDPGGGFNWKSEQVPYFFAHQLSIFRYLEQSSDYQDEGDAKDNQIKVFIQVCASNDVGMKSVLGYGSLSIPTECSCHYDFEVQTSKLIPCGGILCKILYQTNDYYFGCAVNTFNQMKDYFFNSCSGTGKRSFHPNRRIMSKASGRVRVRACVMSKSGRNKDGNEGRRYMLDEILSKVRRHKRSFRQLKGEYTRSPEHSLNQSTRELLSRVKARKEARHHHQIS